MVLCVVSLLAFVAALIGIDKITIKIFGFGFAAISLIYLYGKYIEMKRKNQYLTSSVGFNDYNQDNQLVINSSDEEEKGLSKENRINSIIIPD